MKLARFIEEMHRLANREWSSRAAALGLSYSEFEYLRAIQAQETEKTDKDDHGQHLQDVVAEMGVRKASASAMVLKLEERELVFRVPCRFDARAQHILLTAKGNEMVSAGQQIYDGVAQALESRFSSGDLTQLTDALNTLSS